MAENLLLGQAAPIAPNQVWVGDITYLPLVGGRWCYLATWRDIYYTSSACRMRLEKAQALASYSRPGNPYDNAQAEAGWSTLKTELLSHGGAFASLDEARLEVAYYLDTYFNLDRRHSAFGYRSLRQFERDFQFSLSQCTVCFYWTTPINELATVCRCASSR